MQCSKQLHYSVTCRKHDTVNHLFFISIIFKTSLTIHQRFGEDRLRTTAFRVWTGLRNCVPRRSAGDFVRICLQHNRITYGANRSDSFVLTCFTKVRLQIGRFSRETLKFQASYHCSGYALVSQSCPKGTAGNIIYINETCVKDKVVPLLI
jgi:hypothetical protein